MITLRHELLLAALEFIPKKDNRIFLTGLSIKQEAIGLQFTASDGHTLFTTVEPIAERLEKDLIIPRETLTIALKLKRPHYELTENSLGGIPFTPVEGKYPDFKKLFAESGSKEFNHGLNFNFDYLARIKKAYNAFYQSKNSNPIMRYGASCAMCEMDNGHTYFIVGTLR